MIRLEICMKRCAADHRAPIDLNMRCVQDLWSCCKAGSEFS